MRRSLLITICYLLSAICLFAADNIYVTNVKKIPVDGDGIKKIMTTIVLNKRIKVKEIQIDRIDGKTILKYPTYVSEKGKEYPQFEPLTEQAKEEIKNAVINGKASEKSSKKITYKISKFTRYNGKSALKVFCAVDFNNSVRVECKIMEGKDGPWVAWPSRKLKNGERIRQVVIKKKIRKFIEADLIRRYREMLTESSEEEDGDW
ncbi:MAG: septation protein SpoVG family protein [Elusimicrobia bacterium]|nr:septation protein SpoVG family protein [Elusimicrobiota bacterium]